MGAAAGVAAAFGAPIGGILFSLEEVSSFWDPELTWTTFIAATVAAFTVEALRTAADGDGSTQIGGSHFSLVFTTADGACTSSSAYDVWEVLPFAAIGALCGLLGALFNATNTKLTRARKRLFRGRSNWVRVIEATVSVALVVSLFYWVSLASSCREAPEELQGLPSIIYEAHRCDSSIASSSSSSSSSAASSSGSRRLSGGGDAPMYTEINELATLLLQPQEEALLQLFTRGTAGYFGLVSLAVFAATYFCAAVFTYGLFMPSGLFVPCMLTGAAVGRLAGELLRLAGASGVDPGLYALVGAAGMLGGVTRMTISLTVILLEVSSDIQLLMPIMIAILCAKVVGDRFTESLYDIHIGLGGSTILEAGDHALGGGALVKLLPAKAIMATHPHTVRETEEVPVLRQLLRDSRHSGFPVVQADGSRVFVGFITRQKLEVLLARQAAPVGAAPSGNRRAKRRTSLPSRLPPGQGVDSPIPSRLAPGGDSSPAQGADEWVDSLGDDDEPVRDAALSGGQARQRGNNRNNGSANRGLDRGTACGYGTTDRSRSALEASRSSREVEEALEAAYGPRPERGWTGRGTSSPSSRAAEVALEAGAAAAEMREIGAAPLDETRPPLDTTRPPLGTTRPPLDTTRPPLDTTLPARDCHGNTNYAVIRDHPATQDRVASARTAGAEEIEEVREIQEADNVSPASTAAATTATAVWPQPRLRRRSNPWTVARVAVARGGGAPRSAATSAATSAAQSRRRPSTSPTSPTIDLLRHCDRAPFTVRELLPLYMVARLFTSMGLRHLCVLDSRARVSGVITRKDFAKAHRAGLQNLSSYAHLAEGGVVQKRMLDASFQAERIKAHASQSTASGQERRGLSRSLSEPSMLQLAAARVAAEQAEKCNGSFQRRRTHSLEANKRLATILRSHSAMAGGRGSGGDGAGANGRAADDSQ